jgi:Smg protein
MMEDSAGKDTVLEVLMYLFDNYAEDDYELTADQETLRSELVQAGFGDGQVQKAFEWLEGLALQKEMVRPEELTRNNTFRLFNDQEMEKLDAGCRGFLMFLEQAGILDGYERELVVDRVMALESDEIDLPQLKWIILMVLLNQPGKDMDANWMEDIVMDEAHSGLH